MTFFDARLINGNTNGSERLVIFTQRTLSKATQRSKEKEDFTAKQNIKHFGFLCVKLFAFFA